MRLSELTAYAGEKYHISEQYKWTEFPGFSVLVDPETGKWAVLLMRQWDADRGEALELADVRCGRESLEEFRAPYLSAPFRMRGARWIGVRFDGRTDAGVVRRLLDRALLAETPGACTLVLDSARPAGDSPYRETALPARRSPHPGKRAVPERLREMRRLYEYGDGSFRQVCRNFCVQGRFMADYEDHVPWRGEFRQYYPTYHDLREDQLRGYFTWRANLRRGEYAPVPTSLAYIYIYELLNGIGASDTADRLKKLREFEIGYLDSGVGEPGIRKNLRMWMFALAVTGGLPPETVREYADPEMMRRDAALAALRKPEKHSDGEVFEALCTLDGDRISASPVTEEHGEEGRRLFAAVWREAAAQYRSPGKSLFTACFGVKKTCRWHPLGNAVYYETKPPEPVTFMLNECRKYSFRDGVWQEQSYRKLSFDRKRLESLLREADRLLRAYLKTGRMLRARDEDAWAAPYAEAVIEADRRAKREAARKKVTIRFGELDRIRADAALTRESLLTEAERSESEPVPAVLPAPEPLGSKEPGAPLDAGQIQLLTMLLRGESVRSLVAAAHAMPTVVADALNEALFEELGDSAVACDGEEITLVEDYREDILRVLGGVRE